MDIFLDILLKPPQPFIGLFFILLLTLDQLVTTHDFTMESDLEGLTASDQVDQKEQGACASKQSK